MTIVDPVETTAPVPRRLQFAHADVQWRLSLPPSADELIDEAKFWADERLPYWADLWPSARALARFLIDSPPAEPKSSPIIELGCGGIALASLALARQGFQVLATDYEEDALASVLSNRDANDIAGDACLRTRMVDWREPPVDLGRFALAIAADVMYEQRHAHTLATAVPLIVAPGGRFLLADPGRRYLPEFQGRMKQRGWRERQLRVIEEPQDDPTKPSSRVRVLEFTAPK